MGRIIIKIIHSKKVFNRWKRISRQCKKKVQLAIIELGKY